MPRKEFDTYAPADFTASTLSTYCVDAPEKLNRRQRQAMLVACNAADGYLKRDNYTFCCSTTMSSLITTVRTSTFLPLIAYPSYLTTRARVPGSNQNRSAAGPLEGSRCR